MDQPKNTNGVVEWYLKLDAKYHPKSRRTKPESYPPRFPVPTIFTPWSYSYPLYQPPYFVDNSVFDRETGKKPSWADRENIPEMKRPLNPIGRTGICGRGLLGKWGANFAADPIVTRINPETKLMEVLVVKRKDCGQWALPGGMVDKGELVTQALRRELGEEATGGENIIDMSKATKIYEGYVDDPRNTDNAWIETTAYHKHLSPDEVEKVRLKAGDDATDAQWIPVNAKNLQALYANHGDFVHRAVCSFFDSTGQVLGDEVRSSLLKLFEEYSSTPGRE